MTFNMLDCFIKQVEPGPKINTVLLEEHCRAIWEFMKIDATQPFNILNITEEQFISIFRRNNYHHYGSTFSVNGLKAIYNKEVEHYKDKFSLYRKNTAPLELTSIHIITQHYWEYATIKLLMWDFSSWDDLIETTGIWCVKTGENSAIIPRNAEFSQWRKKRNQVPEYP